MPKGRIGSLLLLIALTGAAAALYAWLNHETSPQPSPPADSGQTNGAQVREVRIRMPRPGDKLSWRIKNEMNGDLSAGPGEGDESLGPLRSDSELLLNARFVWQSKADLGPDARRVVWSPEHGPDGDWRLRELPADDPDACWAIARVRVIRHAVNGRAVTMDRDDELPFLFRLDSGGRISHLAFMPGIGSAAMALLGSAALQLQLGLPDGSGTERVLTGRWQSLEADLNGASQWESRVTAAGGIERERRRAPRGDVRSSRVTVTLDSTRPWGIGAAGRETLALSPEEGIAGTYQTEWSVTPVDWAGSDGEPDTLAETIQWFLGSSMELDRATLPDPSVAGRTAAMTVADVRDLFLTKYRGDNLGVSKLLVTWLRQHPEAAAELFQWLLAEGENMDPYLANALWEQYAVAGTPAIQQMFADVFLRPDATDFNRIKAAGHAHLFTAPERVLTDALLGTWTSPQRRSDDSDVVRNAAVLAFGSLGSDRVLNRPLAKEIRVEISRQLRSAGDLRDRQTMLHAAGNAGVSGLLPDVEPFMADASPDIRAAAFEAVRFMEPADVDSRVLARIGDEKSDSVRAAAVDALGHRPSAERVAWATGRMAVEDGESSQLALVRLLGKRIEAGQDKDGAADAALRALAARMPGIRVRQEVYRYISPAQPGR